MSLTPIFSPAQVRAARGLLNLSAEELASRARLEAEAVEIYEMEGGTLSRRELLRLSRALDAAGVRAIAEQLAGEGVRLAHRSTSARLPQRSPLPDWAPFGEEPEDD